MMITIQTLLQDTRYDKKAILEKLICHRIHIPKERLFMDIDRFITEEDEQWITHAYHAYTVDKQPLEYIIGSVYFAGHQFVVTPATLIPRPETEYMIQAVTEHLEQASMPYTLIDIGTGCGVLGLSACLHHPSRIDAAYLCDLSADALAVAEHNKNLLLPQDTHMPDIIFLESNLLDHSKLQDIIAHEQLLIVANLPYIPDQTFDDNIDETVRKREPRMAFVGGHDGLDLYRIMFDQLHASVCHEAILFLEMMTRQVDILRKAYEHIFSFEEVATFHFNIKIVKAVYHSPTH